MNGFCDVKKACSFVCVENCVARTTHGKRYGTLSSCSVKHRVFLLQHYENYIARGHLTVATSLIEESDNKRCLSNIC